MYIVLSLIVSVVMCFWTSDQRVQNAIPPIVSVQVSIAPVADGQARLFVADGETFAQTAVATLGIERSASFHDYRFLIRPQMIKQLRVDVSVPVKWQNRTVVVCCDVGFRQPRALNGVAQTKSLVAESTRFASPTPLQFWPPRRMRWYKLASFSARCLTLGLAFVVAWRHVAQPVWHGRLMQSPATAILAVSCLVALTSLYPVVFANRSLVSPGNGGNWLAYPSPPFAPGGLGNLTVSDVRGSDTGANAWQYRSYSVVQNASLGAGEWPLYNRYSSAGVSLVGQGTSQWGDPLQWLTIAANGAGWSWDTKYFLAKLLLCAGTATAVLLTSQSLAAALVMAGSIGYIGFFAYRLNHPAYFALCYAPWLWVGFCLLTGPGGARRRCLGWLILLAASWNEMNCGAVKEGYVPVLLAFIGGGGVGLYAIMAGRQRWPTFIALAAACILIPLITAPNWLTFIDNLQHSVNYAPNTRVSQLPSALAPVLIDNAFFTAISHAIVGLPSANPFIVCLAIIGLLSLPWSNRSPIIFAVAAMTALCFSIAFALIPAKMVTVIPFIGGIGHVADDFLQCSIPLMALLAGNGIAFLASPNVTRVRPAIILAATLLLTELIGRYIAAVGNTPSLQASEFHAALLVPATFGTVVAIIVIATAQSRPRGRVSAFVLCASLLVSHIGYGMHLPFLNFMHSDSVAKPADRVSFAVRSPGLELAQGLGSDPYRVVGIDGFLFPGYNASWLIESINGPEALIVPEYRKLLTSLGFEDSFHWGWLHLVHRADLARLGRALDVLNVRMLIAAADSNASVLGGSLVGSSDVTVVERPNYWPRAFLTGRIVPGVSTDDFAFALRMSDDKPFAMVDPAQTLPFTRGPAPALASAIVPARDYTLTPNTTTLTIDAPHAGLLVVSEIDLPGQLRATLDGAAVQPIRVNGAFQGYIIAQAGRHILHIVFVPFGWNTGWSLCALGVAGSLAIGLLVALASSDRLRFSTRQVVSA